MISSELAEHTRLNEALHTRPESIVAVFGPTGAGKTSLIDRVLQSSNKFVFPTSYTTRAQRSEDWKFNIKSVSLDQYLQMREEQRMVLDSPYIRQNGETQFNFMIEEDLWNAIKGGKTPIFDLSINQLDLLRSRTGLGVVPICVMSPNLEMLTTRLEQRLKSENSPAQLIADRLLMAAQEHEYFSNNWHTHGFHEVIINSDFGHAFEKFSSALNTLGLVL